jgi:phthalate 4,5-cis-dihydrodiol dehydrogenase
MPNGVMIYGNETARLDPLPPPQVPRREVIDEFYAAIMEGEPPLHDGTWGRSTMEICLAMRDSAREGGEIALEHQTDAIRDETRRDALLHAAD